jgi:hypothetical protein
MSIPIFYNRSCPEPVSVTLNQTFLTLDGVDSVVFVDNQTHTCDAVGSPVLTLAHVPLAGYALSVYVNGLLQEVGTHYTVDGDEITFMFAMTEDAVQAIYAYEP